MKIDDPFSGGWTAPLDQEAMEENKARKVQGVLMYMPVTYKRHQADAGLTPNMATVNGYSIIWHSGSFGNEYEDEVEVRNLNGDCERVLISKLKELVS